MENQPQQLSAHVSVPGSVDMTFQLSAEVAEMIITGDKHLRSVAMRLCSHRHSVLTRNQSHLLNVNGINTVTKLKPNGYFTSNAMISSPALMLVWASSIKTHNTTSTPLVYDLMWFNKTDEKGWFSICFSEVTKHFPCANWWFIHVNTGGTSYTYPDTPPPLLFSLSPAGLFKLFKPQFETDKHCLECQSPCTETITPPPLSP